jgi:hypothetical protein
MSGSQSSFGEDRNGELYVTSLSAAPNGTVYRIVDPSVVPELFSDGFEAGNTGAWNMVSP